MSPSSPPAIDPQELRRKQRWISATSLVAGVICGAFIILLLGHSSPNPWRGFWSYVSGRSMRVDVSQPTVVNRIQQLRRLETVVYTMDKVISGQRENAVLPDFLAGDKILLLVHGQVVAGIDFEAIRSSDVALHRKDIALKLPEAQIFTVTLDNQKTRVYSRQTGLLVPADPDLETRVRQEAERQLRQAALEDGILQTAQQNARSTMSSMMTSLGFDKVDFK